MPLETITISVTGANPQTKTVQMNVDPNTGAGSTVTTVSGTHGGQDSVQATTLISGTNYASNTISLAWQATNGAIAVTPVTAQFWSPGATPPNTGTWTRTNTSSPTFTATYNSLMFNSFATNLPGIPTNEQNRRPLLNNQISSTGTFVSDVITPVGGTSGADANVFDAIFTGTFVVAQAGQINFSVWSDDAFLIGVQGATRISGPLTLGGFGANTPKNSYPILAAVNTRGPGGPFSFTLSFPAPGIYPFEIDYTDSGWGALYFNLLASNQVIRPVAAVAPPAPSSPGSGNLILSAANGTTHVVGDSVTLNLVASGIHYTTKSYIPLLEGTVGHVYLYNSAVNPVFDFPTFNGATVDKTAAASAAFTISGNNNSWQGRVGIAYSPTALPGPTGAFELVYTPTTPFDSMIDATVLTLQSKDVGWYRGSNQTFDLFTPSLSGGGNSFQIEVDYMPKPTISSVNPTTVVANGSNQVFSIRLNKPFSPQQQGANNTGNVVNPPTILLGSTPASLITPVYDVTGKWLTGWDATIALPNLSTNSTANLTVNCTGTLTYLSGDVFVTSGAVTYLNNVVAATINLTGQGFTAPTVTTVAVNPKTGTAPNYTVTSGTTETLTATVSSTTNNSITCTFYAQSHGSSTRQSLGSTSSPVNSYSSGGLFFKDFSLAVNDATWYSVNDIGAQATDNVSSLSSNLFFDSGIYTLFVSGGGGGGGGGGCFTEAVEIQTPAGFVPFGSLPKTGKFEVVNRYGTFMAELVIHEGYKGTMIELAPERMVTLDHLMGSYEEPMYWTPANDYYPEFNGYFKRVEFEGTVYNLHVDAEDFQQKHYILFNNDVAHNLKAPG